METNNNDSTNNETMEREFEYIYIYRPGAQGLIYRFNWRAFNFERMTNFSTSFYPNEVALADNRALAIHSSPVNMFEIIDLRNLARFNGPPPTVGNNGTEWHTFGFAVFYDAIFNYIGSHLEHNNNDSRKLIFNFNNGGFWDGERCSGLHICSPYFCPIVHFDKLYVINAQNRRLYKIINDRGSFELIYEYDTQEDQYPHMGVAVVSHIGDVWLIGGTDGINVYETCQMFTSDLLVNGIITDQDLRGPKLNFPRCYHTLVIANSKLYVVGGYTAMTPNGPVNFCRQVEVYNSETNLWEFVGDFPDPIAP